MKYAALLLVGLFGCSSSSGSNETNAPDGSATADDFVAAATDFDCLQNSEWTTVGLSKYKNTLGHTDEMLAVARSLDGGTLPVGTIVQLVPGEASVKRGTGFNAASNDWEFFSLGTTASGTTITARGGGANVVNFTGSSCLSCHAKAAPQWDLICGDESGGNTHGCDALPLPGATLASLQTTDPRCHD